VAPLPKSYRSTAYRVTGVAPAIDIRVGEPCPALDRLLAEYGVKNWAFITAWNPMSRLLPADENHRRASRLAVELADSYRVIAGCGVGDAGDWVPEESLLVLGIAEADAVASARRFGQRAIVAGERGGLPRLVGCI